MSRIRSYLALAGKGDKKVAAVFGVSSDRCAAVVRHLHGGAPEIPVWLFSATTPDPDTAALCERIFVNQDSMALLIEAEKQLWPCWVALAVSTWTGEHGRWPVKLAPFLIPFFRTLYMNEHCDFFAGTPAAVLRHVNRRLRDGVHSGWSHAKDLHRGVWLWLFATLAQRSAPLSRWVFHKYRGQAQLAVEVAADSSDGIDVFRYQSRHWDFEAVTRFVHSSTARYLLFQTGEGDPAPMLPLFSKHAQTFAVSRQVDYLDWKPSLFATAPFRKLQPGEASQTLAPVSDFLLVDRAKLAALGIPKTVVPGTAWLLIFWRAAAAGWRSFSVGQSAELDYTPDWPYEEAEFVTRVLSEPALRALGPVEPALSRGNIASAVGATRRASRKTVLVVSPYLPYPLSHGGAVRIYNLCRALAPRVDFILACFRELTDTVDYAKLHEVFREVYVVDRDSSSAVSMSALIAKLCADGGVELLQVEFTQMAHYRDAAPRTPAILVEHDLTFTLYRQFPSRRREYDRWLAYERRWLPRFDAVWTMSDEDSREAIAEGASATSTVTVANGVDIERFVPLPQSQGSIEVLYVGSFRHFPNIIGFERLCHRVMPIVWRSFADARLRVVAGPDPGRYWQAARPLDSRIEMHEFVEDLRPIYAQASVVAVPLEVSAGTNIKVMEAMACGRAVVSTPAGCAGLGLHDGCDVLIRSTDEDFAEALCDLIADPQLRCRMSQCARRTVEDRFSWTAIADRAYESYMELQP